MAQCQGTRAQMVRLYFGFQLCRKCCKNPQSARSLRNVTTARAITWLLGVTIYCTIGIATGAGAPGPSQIQMLQLIKNVTKKIIVFSFF